MTRMLSGAGSQGATVAVPGSSAEDPMASAMKQLMSGGRMSRKQMKELEQTMRAMGDGASTALARDPLDVLGDVEQTLLGGAQFVVFDREGRLLALSAHAKQMWDVVTGTRLGDPATARWQQYDPSKVPQLSLDQMTQ